MYKEILLCTDGSPASGVALDYAIWFARPLGARLHVLYVTELRILEGPLAADISGALGAQPYPGLVPLLQQMQSEKAGAIREAARARCGEAEVECITSHETGNLVPVLLERERPADLVVLGQHGEHARWHGEMLGSSVERMVRASIKPALVTPDEFRPIGRLLIAYDGSEGAKQALQAGIGIVPALEVDAVTLVTVCLREQEERASRTLQEGQQWARDHGVTVASQLLHGDPETEILRAAEQCGADLIVMGAYGHTRIREFVVGSTTSHVLRKAGIPVLLTRKS